MKYCGVEKKHQHDSVCCTKSDGFCPAQFCKGGHSSHCPPREFDLKFLEEHRECTLQACCLQSKVQSEETNKK